MNERELENMPLDSLWRLHELIVPILRRKLAEKTSKLQDQLQRLSGRYGGSSSAVPRHRPHPKCIPKFQNPDNPSETWTGRGKTPRWLATLIASGRLRDEFRIPTASPKTALL